MSEPAPVTMVPVQRTRARVPPVRVTRRPRPLDPEARRARTAQALAALDAAETRFQWRDLTGAERLAREALAGLPNEPRAHYFLGLVLLAMDRAGDAARAFRHTIDLDPSFADVTNKLHIAEERAAAMPSATEP